MARSLLTLKDLSSKDLFAILERAKKLKADIKQRKEITALNNRVVGILFEKPSTRTRASFEAATLRLGGQAGLLMTNKTSTTQGIFTGPDEDNVNNRNQLNYWVFAGGGFKYKMNKSYLFVDLRYNVGLNKYLVSADKRFEQPNHNWVYMYQDSDFRLNSFMLSAGFAYSIFNPKRIK